MAVMGRKKQMIANIIQGRESKASRYLQERKKKDKLAEEKISEEENKKRLAILEAAGIKTDIVMTPQ